MGRKPSKGQINLIGEVHQYDLPHQPHKETTKTGETIVVVRVLAGASDLDRQMAIQASKQLAAGVKTSPNKFYRMKRPRSQGLTLP